LGKIGNPFLNSATIDDPNTLMIQTSYASDVHAADSLAGLYQESLAEVKKVIFGQDEVVKMVLLSIFCNGHSLLIGVPGLAKTLLVQTVARVLDLQFSRIQFTPDLMPSDITGSEILTEERAFKFIKGPVFANIILADEINRTPPKTQAALLEAMQERTVTVAGVNNQLPSPFFVLATQNPIEQEGTYPLPEAQLDRFMFEIRLDYPSFKDELEVVRSTTEREPASLSHLMNAETILNFQSLVKRIPLTDNVLEYAVRLASSTRPNTALSGKAVNNFVNWGAGPRASQYLVTGAKCHAVFMGKYSPDIEDVQAIAVAVLRHRIVLNYRAEAEGITIESFIRSLF